MKRLLPVPKQRMPANTTKPLLTEEQIAYRKDQVRIGKNTREYECYIEEVTRATRGEKDPHTPNPRNRRSLRSWRGIYNEWRMRLHRYNPDDTERDHRLVVECSKTIAMKAVSSVLS
jgi:hypothetical protein